MTHPFEQVKNYTNEFINPKDKEEFSNLGNLVSSYNEEGVDAWFKEKKKWLKIKGKENLAKAIGNNTYYFSVSGKIGMSRQEIENLEYKKYLIVLKHFKLEEQFRILTQHFKMESEDVFRLLYKTAKEQKKEELFYNSRIILDPLLALFSKHEFDKLRNIEAIIEKNMVDFKNSKVAFFYKNGSSYFNVINHYSITDEIMFNYTQEKKEFIESYGQQLPLKEKAYQLLEDMNNYYKNKDWISQSDNENLKNITKQIDTYIKATIYFDLNKKFPVKNINNTFKKI